MIIVINETTNLSVNITVKDANENDITVMYLNVTLDGANNNLSMSCNTTNKPLATANAAAVKAQYDEFMLVVKDRALELGYVIF